MGKFIHQSTENTPDVFLCRESLVFRISGISKPLNALAFYNKILQWLDDNQTVFEQKFTCEFNFEYINTSSQKMIYDIFKKLESINRQYNTIQVVWHCKEDNEDIKEIGEDIFRLVDFPFEITSDSLVAQV